MNRKQIIQSTLDWVDTPYHHHGMVKGAGVDCAMLVAAVALEHGCLTKERLATAINYPTQWHLHNREERLLEQIEAFGAVRVDDSTLSPGDIVTFKYGRTTSHLGIMVSATEFVHARVDMGKVVINSFNEEFRKRWTATYQFPGVSDE